VHEFVERRVVWIELAPERLPPTAPPLQKALAMVLLPEEQLPDCSKAIRAEVAGTSLDAEIDDVIAAILVARFSGRTVPEICAMGGITVDDFTSSVAYREIFGLGHQEGRQEGRQSEAAALTLRQLRRRCGTLSSRLNNPASTACPWAISKPWPMTCSISMGRKTSTPG